VWYSGVSYFSRGAFSLGECRLQTAKTLLKDEYCFSPSTSVHNSFCWFSLNYFEQGLFHCVFMQGPSRESLGFGWYFLVMMWYT